MRITASVSKNTRSMRMLRKNYPDLNKKKMDVLKPAKKKMEFHRFKMI